MMDIWVLKILGPLHDGTISSDPGRRQLCLSIEHSFYKLIFALADNFCHRDNDREHFSDYGNVHGRRIADTRGLAIWFGEEMLW